MAIVSEKSDLYRDEQAGGSVLNSNRPNGEVRCAVGTASHAATDSNGSRYKLIDLPSYAILMPRTSFDMNALSFAALRIGTYDDVDALVSVAQGASVHSPIAAHDANHAKELWEVLGMASDPGGVIGLYQHAIADATGDGTLPFVFEWLG